MSFRKIMMIASMATVLMTTVAMADENAGNQVEMKDGKPVVSVCTSPKDDLYGWAGGKIAANLSKDFTLINVRTNGAHDNLEKVANGEFENSSIYVVKTKFIKLADYTQLPREEIVNL